jgi:hypothetical protein
MSDLAGLLAAFSALASAVATGLAAYASWRGPSAAAEIAENLRRVAEKDNERKRQKFWLFATLMQERSAIHTESAVRALNMIDAVFHDVRPVREAWAQLYLKLNTPNLQSLGFTEELRHLLTAMANDIGLADQFGHADAARVYIPNALAQERMVHDLERQQALARLQGTSPTANTAPQIASLFPLSRSRHWQPCLKCRSRRRAGVHAVERLQPALRARALAEDRLHRREGLPEGGGVSLS